MKAKSLDKLSKDSWDHGISINLKMAFLVTWARRPGTQEEVGHVCLFLASNGASYVTGQLIVIHDGNAVQEYKVAR